MLRQQLAVPSATRDEFDCGLLEEIAKRDRRSVDAFSSLYDRHASYVYGVSLRFLRNREEAEDVLQEVFEKLWQREIRFQPGAARFTTWLFTVTRNRCLDRLKNSSRKPPHAPLPNYLSELSEADADPETDIYIVERATRIRGAVQQLPEDQRSALELCAFQGLTHIEAAEALSIPLGTLKSRVRLAMLKLSDALDDLREEK